MNSTTDTKEKLLPPVSHQRECECHVEAMKAFQDLNKGTHLTPTEFYKGIQWDKEKRRQFINAVKEMNPIGEIRLEYE